MTKPVAFSEDGARRVIAATKAHEAGNRDMPGVKFRDSGGDGDPVRLGITPQAGWSKGAVITIATYENGTPPNETTSSINLPNCVNKFANVAGGKWVIVARGVNGYWYLIAAECA
jgi:hypothetical protein